MRGIWISTALVTMALAASSASHAQFFSKTPQAADAPKTAAAPPQAPATATPAPQAAPAPRAPCANANALGVARTVEIDTTGGPGFGLEQYKAHDFLQPGEVVLTFDDGPWPTTKPVLEALAHHCTKATFFTIGKNAIIYPNILKEVAAGGHTVGVHTWSHANLRKATPEKMKEEIEKGLSAVKIALGNAPAPFFRFPFLQDPHDAVAYLGTRNIAIFSMDLDSFDFKIKKADEVVKSVMTKLEKKGKGIILMHDFQLATSHGIMELLNQLKAKGYKVVHLKPKAPAATIPEFDQAALAEFKGPISVDRPTSSVVRTVD